MRDVPTLRIADVLAGSGADWAAYLDSERVGRYTQNLDATAPVVVFDTEDGLLRLRPGARPTRASRWLHVACFLSARREDSGQASADAPPAAKAGLVLR
jgi:hypothetical protein